MDYGDIKNTASHETAHIHNQSHDIDFQNKQIDTQASLWEPPAGTIRALPEYPKRKEEKSKEKKIIKNECHYYSCKKKGKIKECPYCKNYFCDEHIHPREAHLTNLRDNDRRMAHFKDYAESNHPCFEYNKFLEDEVKRRRIC